MVMQAGPVIRAPGFYNNGSRYLTTVDQGVNWLNDQLLELGDDQDIVLLNRSTALNANTALTGVLEGTPVTTALSANSLIISNTTADGDITLATNRGGNSEERIFIEASSASVIRSVSGGNITLDSSTGHVLINAASRLFFDGGGGTYVIESSNDVLDLVAGDLTMLRLAETGSGAGTVTLTTNLDINGGYIQLEEMSAPGAGAADHVRIYAVIDGGSLTDLAAVFQDGTVDIFAQETTPLDSPVFRYPSNTVGQLRMRKPHPGSQIWEMVYSDGTTFTIKEIEHHDAAKIAADVGSEGPLPVGWVVETAAQRASRLAAEEALKTAPEDDDEGDA